MQQAKAKTTAAEYPRINPYAALVIAVVGISFGSILAKLSDAPALIIATYRNAFATLILLPFALTTCRKELRSIGAKDFLAASTAGMFLAFHFATWIKSLEYTTVASSTVLVTLQPIFVVLGSVFVLKERVGKKALAAGSLAVVGSIIIGAGDFAIGGSALWGDFLALSGALFIAVYVLIGRSLRQRFSLVAYTFIVYGFCSLFLFMMDFIFSVKLYPYSLYNWLLFWAMALIPTTVGHTLLNWALKYLPAPTVSVSVLGEPVGASILAAIFLGEYPGAAQLVGSMLILTGVYFFMKFSREEGT
ncbi:MAG: DMT family transporter [Clostridia bacterium]|nr:DMT family transporter [Clostridia bacterium]